MAPALQMQVIGLAQARRKLDQVARDLHGPDMSTAMRKAVLLVTRDAKIFAPVDTGRLRSSITGAVIPARSFGKSIQGIIGSNVFYAPFQEIGTRHMKGRKFLQRSIDKNEVHIQRLIGDAVVRIVRK